MKRHTFNAANRKFSWTGQYGYFVISKGHETVWGNAMCGYLRILSFHTAAWSQNQGWLQYNGNWNQAKIISVEGDSPIKVKNKWASEVWNMSQDQGARILRSALAYGEMQNTHWIQDRNPSYEFEIQPNFGLLRSILRSEMVRYPFSLFLLPLRHSILS